MKTIRDQFRIIKVVQSEFPDDTQYKVQEFEPYPKFWKFIRRIHFRPKKEGSWSTHVRYISSPSKGIPGLWLDYRFKDQWEAEKHIQKVIASRNNEETIEIIK